jgi:signal peptidase II
MLVFFPRVPEKARVTRLGMGLVIGGALGNAFDRVNHGAVIDFIHYQIPGVVSNVSNLADHAIVVGVLLIVLQSWRSDEKADAPVSDEPEASAPDIDGESS